MQSAPPWLWVIVAVVAIVLAVVIVLAVRRHRWVKSLEEQGWTFVDSPSYDSVSGLACPPFGQGFDRRVDDQAHGRIGARGTDFQVLEYRSDYYDDRLAVLRLRLPLPELYLSHGTTRRRAVGAEAHPHPRWHVGTTDHDFAAAVLPALDGPLQQLAERGPVDLAVDGTDLVALGAAKEVEQLRPWLDALAAVGDALDALDLERFRQPEPERHFRFHGHPDWVYHGHRVEMLDHVSHTTGGFGHEARHVITGDAGQLPFIALSHHWKTTRTVTESDGKGGTRTRTVTDHHSEDIFEIALPVAWPVFTLGGSGWFQPGEKVTLESEAFNEAFSVRSGSAKFAHDILHPRQMEYLMAVRPPAFAVHGAVLRVSSHHDSLWIGGALADITGFLARIPVWVWKDLGLPEQPAFCRPELG